MQAKLKEQIFAHGLWSAHRRPVCFSPGQCRFPTRCLGATPAQPMLVQSSARLSGLQPRCLTSRGAVEVLHGGPAALLKLFSRRALPAGQARKHASMTCSQNSIRRERSQPRASQSCPFTWLRCPASDASRRVAPSPAQGRQRVRWSAQ